MCLRIRHNLRRIACASKTPEDNGCAFQLTNRYRYLIPRAQLMPITVHNMRTIMIVPSPTTFFILYLTLHFTCLLKQYIREMSRKFHEMCYFVWCTELEYQESSIDTLILACVCHLEPSVTYPDLACQSPYLTNHACNTNLQTHQKN